METSPDRTRRSGGHARSGPLLRTRDADAAPPRHRAPAGSARVGTRGRPGRRSATLLAAGAAGVAVVLVGGATLVLTGEDAPAPSAAAPPSATAAASASPSSTVLQPPAAEPSSPAVLAATASDRTPADARVALEEQLAARADATLALLRSTWEGDQPAAARAGQAVAAASSGLSAVVTAWQDADLATSITARLDDQSEASRAYAAAVAAGDVVAADDARARMGDVSRELGDVLDSLTDGRIAAYVPPQDAAQYRAFVDALEAQDAGAADEIAAWLRARYEREGAALAPALSEGGPT